jgi:hypothetical protein
LSIGDLVGSVEPVVNGGAARSDDGDVVDGEAQAPTHNARAAHAASDHIRAADNDFVL